MPASKIKQEVKQPDLLQSTFQRSLDWIKTNTRTFILASAIVFVLGLGAWGLVAYQSAKDDRAQYALSLGMRSYQEYASGQNKDALGKAEEHFKKATAEGSRNSRDIAKLYLARIAAAKGTKNEAESSYSQLSKEASNQVIKDLAQAALLDLKAKK